MTTLRPIATAHDEMTHCDADAFMKLGPIIRDLDRMAQIAGDLVLDTGIKEDLKHFAVQRVTAMAQDLVIQYYRLSGDEKNAREFEQSRAA
jgi:hypothetical protein